MEENPLFPVALPWPAGPSEGPRNGRGRESSGFKLRSTSGLTGSVSGERLKFVTYFDVSHSYIDSFNDESPTSK